MDIREKGKIKKGSNFFTTHIVTPNLVKEQKDKTRLIIIPYYDGFELIMEKINEVIFNYGDDNYQSFCVRVSEFLHWEFDYLIPNT